MLRCECIKSDTCSEFTLHRFERVPLGHGSPRRVEHFGPVPQLRTFGVGAQKNPADGFGCTHPVVIHNRDQNLDTLDVLERNLQQLRNSNLNSRACVYSTNTVDSV